MSEQTFDKLYKLVEYVLLGDELNTEEILKMLIDVNTMSIRLNSWCLSKAQEHVYSSICDKGFNLIDDILDTVLKYVVLKHLEGKIKQDSNNVVSRLLAIILEIVNSIKLVVENSMLIQEEKVLCKVLKPVAVGSNIIEKGYMVLLPVDTAVALSALGYVKPINTQVPAVLRS